ncbi:MAG: hypothetical protein NHF85_00370 [Candidatus Shikimatogenerans sp. JK-2022]|nr:hypothetical protein [Candidatus Shikimatogenerans bostrichidophilus]
MKQKKNWYILNIRSGQENIIKYKIKNIFKKKISYKILNPIKRIKIIKNGKKYIKKRNIYSGYLLIKIKLNKLIYYKLKNIEGINSFLNERYNDYPLPLKNKEIKNIIKNLYNQYKKKFYIKKKKIDIGDNVKIINGLFKNIKAIVKKIYKEKSLLNFNILGRPTSIIIKNINLKKI